MLCENYIFTELKVPWDYVLNPYISFPVIQPANVILRSRFVRMFMFFQVFIYLSQCFHATNASVSRMGLSRRKC